MLFHIFLVLRNYFGIIFATLFTVKEEKESHKHFIVFEEAKVYGMHILEEAFRISLQITVRTPIMHDLESRILNLSVQV